MVQLPQGTSSKIYPTAVYYNSEEFLQWNSVNALYRWSWCLRSGSSRLGPGFLRAGWRQRDRTILKVWIYINEIYYYCARGNFTILRNSNLWMSLHCNSFQLCTYIKFPFQWSRSFWTRLDSKSSTLYYWMQFHSSHINYLVHLLQHYYRCQ